MLSASAVPLGLLDQLISFETRRRVDHVRRHGNQGMRDRRKQLFEQQCLDSWYVALGQGCGLKAAKTKAEGAAVRSYGIIRDTWGRLLLMVVMDNMGSDANVIGSRCIIRLCEQHDRYVHQTHDREYCDKCASH